MLNYNSRDWTHLNYYFSLSRLSELFEDTNRKQHHSQHHHLNCWLPPQSTGWILLLSYVVKDFIAYQSWWRLKKWLCGIKVTLCSLSYNILFYNVISSILSDITVNNLVVALLRILNNFQETSFVWNLKTLFYCNSYTGVNQWFLLVLFWKRCHWWAGPEKLFKGDKCGKAGFQYTNRVYPGM